MVEEESSSASLPFSNEITVGNHIITISTRNQIDTSVLLEGINENDDFSSISSKIESEKLSLYPDEEIEVKISDLSDKSGKRSKRAASKITPIPNTAIKSFLEDESISYDRAVSETKVCHLAMIVVNVKSGYAKLEKYLNGSWLPVTGFEKTPGGKTQHWFISGSYGEKGFRVTSAVKGQKVKADVVMKFYKAG